MIPVSTEIIVTRAELTKYLHLDSPRKLDILARRGILVKTGTNKYLLLPSWSNYTKMLTDNLKKSGLTMVGRPRKYTDPREFALKAAQYFERCDAMGDTPLLSGVCLQLQIHIETLSQYAKNSQFSGIIKSIRLTVQNSLEQRALDREGGAGAMFNLKCNFNFSEQGQPLDNTLAGNVVIILPDNGRDKPTHPSLVDSKHDSASSEGAETEDNTTA